MQLKEFKNGEIVRSRIVEFGSKERVTFGRASHNDYPIGRGNAACSRVQATMIKNGNDWLLLDGTDDKLSQNGVFYNGKRITGPLLLKSGIEVDLFLGDTEFVRLKNEPEDLTEGFDGTESQLIAELRADILMLQDRLNNQEEQIASLVEFNTELATTLGAKISDRLDSLSLDLKNALQEADRRAEARNRLQDEQLLKHNTEFTVHRIILSVIVAGVCGWNASKATDQITTIVNVAGTIAALGTGGSQVIRPRFPSHTIPTLSEIS
jgi:FHA domain